ncbi:MAG TPA: hypothetical protein VLG28_11270 [Acidimicrobiia bacterium]|nr:hypothetical protein [Acidimicrobiia bacterium]
MANVAPAGQATIANRGEPVAVSARTLDDAEADAWWPALVEV